MNIENIPERFIEETLAKHWQVNESKESFERLLNHIENRTNFKSYFEQAMSHIPWDKLGDELIIADIGAGVGWTSALLAKIPIVKKVYSIEPSLNRAIINKHILNHFFVDNSKVEVVKGDYKDFNLPEKVDYTVLCASFHHCIDSVQNTLFSNIISNTKQSTVGVLIANEHYVTFFWTLKKILAYYLKHNFESRSKLYWGPSNWRAPIPWDNEHHRTKKECDKIFRHNGFQPTYFIHDGDLCKDKRYKWETALMWRYYHAVLEYKT